VSSPYSPIPFSDYLCRAHRKLLFVSPRIPFGDLPPPYSFPPAALPLSFPKALAPQLSSVFLAILLSFSSPPQPKKPTAPPSPPLFGLSLALLPGPTSSTNTKLAGLSPQPPVRTWSPVRSNPPPFPLLTISRFPLFLLVKIFSGLHSQGVFHYCDLRFFCSCVIVFLLDISLTWVLVPFFSPFFYPFDKLPNPFFHMLYSPQEVTFSSLFIFPLQFNH